MTIIVINENFEVMVDRKHSFDPATGKPPFAASKVVRTPGDAAFSMAGGCYTNGLIKHNIISALDGKDNPCGIYHIGELSEGPNDGQGVARCKEGHLYVIIVTKTGFEMVDVRDVAHNDFAVGCGATWYEAYRALGMSSTEAFHQVCVSHAACGMGFDCF